MHIISLSELASILTRRRQALDSLSLKLILAFVVAGDLICSC